MVLSCDNISSLEMTKAGLFNTDARGGTWILVEHVAGSDDTVHFTAEGWGGLPELRLKLAKDKIQYALVRLAVPGQTGARSVRDVFVKWTGPAVDQESRSRKARYIEEARILLKPSHASVEVTNWEEVNDET
jgi:hypothetical protein